jgi:aryl-alcohol dehydrogenase-like predicted oxidoreductase
MKSLSRIGYGTFKLGRNQEIKYPTPYDLPNQKEATRLIESLYLQGVTYFDTAPSYGDAETKLGMALQSIGIQPFERQISTKIGEYFNPKTKSYYHDFSSKKINESIERSLNELKTDSIDILFIHAFYPDVKIVQQTALLDALKLLKQKGIVHSIGLSGYTNEAFQLIFNDLDAAMVEYHPQKKELSPTIERMGEGQKLVILKKIFGAGVLNPETALRFALSNPNVSSVLMTSLNLKHIQQNLFFYHSINT